jgi:nitrogen regulatory protein PII
MDLVHGLLRQLGFRRAEMTVCPDRIELRMVVACAWAGGELYRGEEVVPSLIPKVRLEIAVNEAFVEPTIDAILAGARHGAGVIGDGKIFVLPLEHVVRIRTGETDAEAL